MKQDLEQGAERWTGVQAVIVAIAPVLFLASILYHPPIARLNDSSAVAGALVADTTRWGLSHLAVAAGSGLVLIAFVYIHRLLTDAGERRWSSIGLPFVIMGSSLFAVMPGLEIGVMAVVEGAGVNAEAAQAALDPWFFPVLLASSVLFLVGAVGFAGGIVRSGVLSPPATRLVFWALLIMALSRFVPFGAALYVSALAAVVAMWPLAGEIRRRMVGTPGYRVGRAPASTRIGG